MTRAEYDTKMKSCHPQMDGDLRWEYTIEFVKSLEAQIAELEEDNNMFPALVSGMQETIDIMQDNQKNLEEYIDRQEAIIKKAAKELEQVSLGCPRDTHLEFDTLTGCCKGYPLDKADCWLEWLMSSEKPKEDK